MKRRWLPVPVQRSLKTFGANLRRARLWRNMSVALLAEAAVVARSTVVALEKGEPGVSIMNVMKIAWILGFRDCFDDIASQATDPQAQILEDETLRRRAGRRDSGHHGNSRRRIPGDRRKTD